MSPTDKKSKRRTGSQSGQAVDSSGGPGLDPTENVIALTEAANQRQDDLRACTKELSDAKLFYQEKIGDLREKHQAELRNIGEEHQRVLRLAEAQRLDSIRQVDREDVNKTAAQALNAIQTLAQTSNTTAETLRNQVATTAAAAANQLATTTGEINKRLSALELALSEGKGKQLVEDPQLARLSALVEKVASAQVAGFGKSAGISASWTILVSAASFIVMLILIGTFIFITMRQPAPPIVVQPPAATVPTGR
jgi:hypothetical protein